MALPEISVIMSVFNGEKHLKDAIESVLNQTYSNFEFLIIDDNSSDKTSEIIKSYHDDRIFFIQNEENLGLTKSLNKALKLAKGKYIARIDHDDIYYPDKLLKQMNFFKQNHDCKILFTDITKIDDSGNTIKSYSRVKTPEDIFFLLHFINPVIHPTIIIEKTILIENNGYNKDFRYSQDYELWSRLIYKFKFYKLNEALVKYRVSNTQISNSNLAEQKKFAEKVFINIMAALGIDIDDKTLYFHKYAYEFNTNLDIEYLKKFKEIINRIVYKAPDFLDKSNLKSVSRQNYIYYWLVYLSRYKALNPLIKFVRQFI